MHLAELKKKTPAELVNFANPFRWRTASSLRKQDILFAILKNLADSDQVIQGEGHFVVRVARRCQCGSIFMPVVRDAGVE